MNNERYAEFKLVDQDKDDLSNYIGWELIRVVTFHGKVELNKQVPIFDKDKDACEYNTNYGGSNLERDVPYTTVIEEVRTTVPKFLLGKPKEDVVINQKEIIRQLNDQVANLKLTIDELNKRVKETEEDIKQKRKQYDETHLKYTKILEENTKQLIELTEAERVADKILAVLGTERFKEVLTANIDKDHLNRYARDLDLDPA